MKKIFNLMIARKQKNITQLQLAKILGVSKGTITAYEINKIKPSIDKLKKMAKILEVTTDFLLER